MSGVEEIRNLCATPYGTVATSYRWNTIATKLESGKYSYAVQNLQTNVQGTFAFKMGSPELDVGDVLVCVFSCTRPELLIVPRSESRPRIAGTNTTEGAVITDTMGWVAGRLAVTDGKHELWIHNDCGPVTMEGAAAFRASDWPGVRELLDSGDLTMPWFAPPLDAATGEMRSPVLVP